MRNKLYIFLFVFIFSLSACNSCKQENVKIHEGYYNSVTAQGFNGYEASSFDISEEDSKIIVTIVWENAYDK